jgi:NAD(P)-dependent dehydrogenase (short-subunit alcohol dehydrogenase family)
MMNNVKFDYTGASVLVTGGTSGIGHAIASAYREAGANVVITGTRASPGDYVDIDLEGFEYRQVQMVERDQVEALASSLDALDILVNNAGASFPAGDEFDTDGFIGSVELNLHSPFVLANACRDKLAASTLSGGASVIGIASMTSFFGTDMVPGYGASKAGLVALAKSLAMKWAPLNIRVNNVAAGLTRTRMTEAAVEIEEISKPILARTPMGRVGESAEIAGAVLFLTSAMGSYITGETLIVDGGFAACG